MRKPAEVRLRYKEESNSSITMLVDQIMDVTYKWQYLVVDFRSQDMATVNNP